LIFAAFAEEIAFRGMLLPSFMYRYGLHRGIFLTGLVWAAIHFRSDTYSGLSPGGVLLHVANRIFLCMALNYLFAWMTLRERSIIPAALAHTAWNILHAIPNRPAWELKFHFALAATLAYVLYRFWPIAAQADRADEGLELSY
jgi:membrane protease YdiL (CAAX protease family)